MKSNTLIKIGTGVVLLVGGMLLANKMTNNGKHLKRNIDKQEKQEVEPDPFKPESFSSIEQADAYETLLTMFNKDSKELYNYLVDYHDGCKDYVEVLHRLTDDYRNILRYIKQN